MRAVQGHTPGQNRNVANGREGLDGDATPKLRAGERDHGNLLT